jgi:hypothetical protein
VDNSIKRMALLIAVMLDLMRSFEDNDVLQDIGCWALVNIALAPTQKAVLMKLGGIQVTTNAIFCHPFNAGVQFWALFALINLFIPCKCCELGMSENRET